MKIKRFLYQNRRDFEAEYECQFCGDIVKKSGYDDGYFHAVVIPGMKCDKCGKSITANGSELDDEHRPRTTKYPDGFQV